MIPAKWDELREPFKRLVFRDGVKAVADRVPMHRASVYRIINDEIRRPCRAIREGVRKVLESDQAPAE